MNTHTAMLISNYAHLIYYFKEIPEFSRDLSVILRTEFPDASITNELAKIVEDKYKSEILFDFTRRFAIYNFNPEIKISVPGYENIIEIYYELSDSKNNWNGRVSEALKFFYANKYTIDEIRSVLNKYIKEQFFELDDLIKIAEVIRQAVANGEDYSQFDLIAVFGRNTRAKRIAMEARVILNNQGILHHVRSLYLLCNQDVFSIPITAVFRKYSCADTSPFVQYDTELVVSIARYGCIGIDFIKEICGSNGFIKYYTQSQWDNILLIVHHVQSQKFGRALKAINSYVRGTTPGSSIPVIVEEYLRIQDEKVIDAISSWWHGNSLHSQLTQDEIREYFQLLSNPSLTKLKKIIFYLEKSTSDKEKYMAFLRYSFSICTAVGISEKEKGEQITNYWFDLKIEED